MTVTEICKWLESANFKQGDRLPSVRSAAESFEASTCTVFRAYRKLVADGKVYGEHGNGFFWDKEGARGRYAGSRARDGAFGTPAP